MAVTVTRTSTLFTDNDGDGVADPGDTLLVHILIQNSNGFDIANLKVYDSQSGIEITDLSTVKITPIALDDFNGAPLTIVGNTPYVISASALLGNDIDPDGPEASLVISSFANASHVTVTDAGGGNLQIVPETGYQGAASFDYFITDAQGLTSVSSGHVNILISGMIWYVDSNASAVGADGSYLHAFTTLGALNDDGTGAAGTVGPADAIKGDDDVDGSGDTIFVYNRGTAYTGGITLEAGQKLYGDGHEFTVNGIAIGASGQVAGPTINYSSYGVTLATDNTISGLNLNGTGNGSVGLQDGNGSVTTAAGTLNVDTVSIGGAGQAVDIDQGGNLNVSLTSLSTTGTAAGQGVQLAGTASSGTALISGTFTAAAGSIAGESSHGFQIGGAGPSSGGTIAVNYAGTIGSSATGSAVNIADRLAGAGNVTFSGNISQTGTAASTAAGIALSNIAGGTIDFTGTKTINVTAGTQNAIQVSGQSGGTINFSGGAIDIDQAAGTTGNGIAVTGQTGGSVNVSTAADIDLAGTASGRGLSISTSTGGSVNFTGGGLTIDSRSGAALFDSNASGTHALNISGTGNTLTTTNGGQLVEIANATTTGMTFATLTTGAAVSGGAAVHVNNLDGGSFNTGGITVTGVTGAGGDGIRIEGGSGTNFSLGNVSVVNTSDDGVELNGANGTVTIDTLNVQNTVGQGVEINGATNAVTITNGTIGNTNDPTQQGVLITGGSGNVTIGASVAKTTTGNVVDVNNHTGGTIAFGGTVSATVTGNGISLTNNTGSTINFTNTLTLTTSGTNTVGFNATGGGTVSASGTGSTISSGSGVALNVVNTSIGSADLNFQSVNVNGAVNGIVLNTTGSAGGLTITGTGTTAGSGGTIQNTTQRGISVISGADIVIKNMNLTNAGTVDNVANNTGLSLGQNTAENAAIHLQNVTNVTLDRIAISGGAEEGINGNTVANFNLSNSTITGVGNAADEDGIHFYNMSGSSSIASTVISGSGDDNVNIQLQSGQLDLAITGNGTLAGGSVSGGVLGSGYLFGIRGTSVANITLDNVLSQNNFSGGIVLDAYDNATMNAKVNSVFSTNNNDQIQVSISGAANADADITNSSFTSTTPTLDFVNMNLLGGSFSTGTLDVRVANNTFTVASGVTADAIVVNQAGGGQMNVAMTGNTINYSGTQRAVLVQGGTDGNGSLVATIQSNTIDMKNSGALANPAFLIQTAVTGPGNTTSIDLDMGGAGSLANNFLHSGGGTIAAGDIRVRQRNDGTLNLDGYSGGGQDTTAIANYLNARNNEISPSTATVDGVTPHNYTGNASANFIVVSVSASSVAEDGATNLIYTFTRLGSTASSLTTSFAITGTATAGTDYSVFGAATFNNGTGLGTVTFAAGSATASITVDPTADGSVEYDESVVVDAGRGSFARALISNDDAGISVGSANVQPGGDQVAGEKPVGIPTVDTTDETGGTGGAGGTNVVAGDDHSAPPAPPAPTVVDDGIVSQGELNLLVSAAIDRWAAAGASPDQLAAMRAVNVSVTDMMGVQIGGAGQGLIQIDNDAAGYGWFVDSTPGDDAEFVGSGTRHVAAAGSAANGHVDLLTVLMHELGHQIGLDDSYRPGDSADVMYGFANVGERRAPAAGEAARANGALPAHEAYLLAPVADVGTLPAGKSVDIQFQATVASFFNQVISPLSNTATVKGDNIADTNSNTNVTVIDTMTLGDRVYIDANNNGTFDAGEGKNGVALTLFADTNNNGVLDIGTDVQLLTTTTAGSGAAIGSYSFANLSAGNYIVRVDASNFAGGGALAGTRGVFGGLDPDNNTDNDDNGIAGPSGSVVAAPITLAYGTETTSDGGAVPKNDINNSLDFGFVANSAPVANPDSVSATEDTQAQYSTELTGNDTDADLDTLTITAVSNFVNGTASVASGIVTFTPTANFNGIASFDYTISDGNGHTATATATVTVGAVNDPVTAAAPPSLALNEDSTNVAVTGLSISDVDAALAPAGVYEVTLSSTHGVLTLTTLTGLTFTGGSDGTADATMTFHGTLADINTALATAKYTPDANYNGPAQISLNATDSFGGTVATGTGTATTDSKNVAVTVNSVNDAPSGADEHSSVVEGASYTFDATNFTDDFSDPIDGNAFKAVIITTLPTTGTLKLNGVAISAGATITLADLNSHLLTYDAPAGSGNTHPTFTFQVQDNGGIANGGVDTDPTPNTYTFDIAAANAAPVLDLDSDNSSTATGSGFASSYTEGGAAAAIADADVQITDADPGDDIVSATITLTNAVTGDKLNVGGLPAGITVDPSSTDTLVKLVGVAGTSAADFQTALQAVTFSSSSDDPTNHGANLARTITVVVNDGAADSNVATTTIAVADDNADAPTATSSTITAVEDTFRVIHASDLGFNDVDGTLKSVTIDSVSGGKIYYDADGAGGADPVEQSIPVAFTLQDLDDGKVSFKANPNANGAGEGSIHFVVIDDDNNAASLGNTLTVDVTAVNDSPVLTASTPVSATEQTAAYILTGVNVSDVDLDAHNGGLGDYAGASFGVNRNPAANAAQDDFDLVAGPNFTIDGINLKTTGGQIFGYINADANGIISVNFTSLETAATTALVNEVIHSITYTNLSDTPPSSVTLAAGFSDGSPGGGQGAGASGLDVELVTVNIGAVNDAPVNSLGGTIGTSEDASNAWLSGMSISDPDADPANDLIYVTFQVQHGELAIRTDVAGGINSGEIIAQAVDTITVQATLNQINATLAASNGLTYSPALNFNGDDTLTVYTNDAGYTGADPGLTGDGTSEEDVDTRTITVSAVDDPAVAVDDSVSTNENAVKTGNVFDANPTTPDSDVDGPALTVSAVGGGTVGTQFALASGALLTVNSDGSYSYDPNGQFNYLVPAASGAVNTTATDQFTYTLLNGNTATVTVTINGVDSVGNVYNGDGTDNVITSGSGNDTFNVSQGGTDTVSGNDGNDYFYFGNALTSADKVDGGLGTDVVGILGNYSMTLGADNLVGIERLTLLSGDTLGGAHVTYALTTVDANVEAGKLLTVLGITLQSDETMVFNGSAETDGSFYIAGGAANDTLVGGQKNDSLVGGVGNDQLFGLAGDDWLLGGAGADTLRGGTGKDSFVYQSTSESTAAATDHIVDFENVSDHIDLSAIDANSVLGGDQSFDFIGQNAFSDTAGELRIQQSGSDWLVMGDTDGDGTADFQVLVSVFNGHIMAGSDFVL